MSYRVEQSVSVNWYKDRNHQILHRVDGPAIEYNNGSKWWYQNGKLHRDNGPAVEYSGGTKLWFRNNFRHRIDGPAVELSDGGMVWYVNGYHVSPANAHKAVARWLSYREVTRDEISSLIGNFRIVEWN